MRYNYYRERSVSMNEPKNSKSQILHHFSIMISVLYILILVILSYTKDLFTDIYSNSSWIELSFILFITYLILYIKDAFVMDFIEIVIEKKEKAFLPHLIEHTIEPFILFILFLFTTRLYLLFDIEAVLPRFLIIVGTPFLYFHIKKKKFAKH
jgi:hypothetical protein